jgi:hypothetical protein
MGGGNDKLHIFFERVLAVLGVIPPEISGVQA